MWNFFPMSGYPNPRQTKFLAWILLLADLIVYPKFQKSHGTMVKHFVDKQSLFLTFLVSRFYFFSQIASM